MVYPRASDLNYQLELGSDLAGSTALGKREGQGDWTPVAAEITASSRIDGDREMLRLEGIIAPDEGRVYFRAKIY